MLVAAAVVPETPLLLPGATGEPVAEVERLRVAARLALEHVLDCETDIVVGIAGGDVTRTWPVTTDPGTARHTGAAASSGEVLPAGLAVLRTMLTDGPPPVLQTVARTAAPGEANDLGSSLADRSSRVGLLVAGDGSARRGPKAPGYLDDRAAPFDAGVEHALADGRAEALLALDPVLAADLLVAGRAAWQVLAGATQRRPVRARLDYCADPFGVAYFVARWDL
jgi:hypothetical protein